MTWSNVGVREYTDGARYAPRFKELYGRTVRGGPRSERDEH